MYNIKIMVACLLSIIVPLITYTTALPTEVKLNIIIGVMGVLLLLEVVLSASSPKGYNVPLEFIVSTIYVYGGGQGIFILVTYPPYHTLTLALALAIALVPHLAAHLTWLIKLTR